MSSIAPYAQLRDAGDTRHPKQDIAFQKNRTGQQGMLMSCCAKPQNRTSQNMPCCPTTGHVFIENRPSTGHVSQTCPVDALLSCPVNMPCLCLWHNRTCSTGHDMSYSFPGSRTSSKQYMLRCPVVMSCFGAWHNRTCFPPQQHALLSDVLLCCSQIAFPPLFVPGFQPGVGMHRCMFPACSGTVREPVPKALLQSGVLSPWVAGAMKHVLFLSFLKSDVLF